MNIQCYSVIMSIQHISHPSDIQCATPIMSTDTSTGIAILYSSSSEWQQCSSVVAVMAEGAVLDVSVYSLGDSAFTVHRVVRDSVRIVLVLFRHPMTPVRPLVLPTSITQLQMLFPPHSSSRLDSESQLTGSPASSPSSNNSLLDAPELPSFISSEAPHLRGALSMAQPVCG